MKPRFEGKTAIVTGGANGIGRATVLRLLKEGAHVAVFDKEATDSKSAKTLQEMAGEFSDRLAYYSLDLTEEKAVEDAVGDILAKQKTIDVLISVAGLSHGVKNIEEFTLEEWERFLSINLTSQFLVTRAVLPSMRECKYGRIVNISSTSGRTASKWTGLAYSSSKAGVIGFTRKLAFEVGKYGITANVVAPGFVETDFVMEALKQAPEGFLDQRLSEIPLHRGAHPDELAAAIAFLASDDASYVTGAVLDVNGGAFIG
jgi:3-oxoacyl-[acyl-carrier protein] reductase